jgi:glycosyltransferase involved in cell wall biosynthesis
MSTHFFEDNNTLVSIILPVWNPRSDWLAEAIASAFNESHCQIEIVLVDDGSDEPPDVWLSPQDAKRVHLIRTPHRGVNHAQNVALKHCRGEFVRFLGGDDVILPESTSKLLELTSGDHDVVSYGSTVICDPHLQPRGILRSRLHGHIHLQTALGYFTSTIAAMLIPRQVAIQVGGFNERLIVQGDWDFVLRLSEVTEFRGTPESVYLYRRHEKSLSSGRVARREAIRSTVRIIKGYLARHPELHGTRAERRLRAYAQFLIAKLENPQFPMRSRRFWKAAAVDPIRAGVVAGSRILAICLRRVKALMSHQD